MQVDVINAVRAVLKSPLYIPHYVLYIKHRKLINSDIKSVGGIVSSTLSFFYLITNDEYFNVLFFHRIKSHRIRKFMIQKKSTFIIPYDVILGKSPILDHPFFNTRYRIRAYIKTKQIIRSQLFLMQKV